MGGVSALKGVRELPAPNGQGISPPAGGGNGPLRAAGGQEGTNCVFPLLSITPFPFSYRGSGTGAERLSRHPSVGILRMKYGGQAREPRTAGFAFMCGLGWCILPIENAGRA